LRRVVVVGSGASGVHFAQTALELGAAVVMVDVGRTAPEPVLPEASFAELKREHDDPAAYFLGRRFEGVLFPGHAGEYYGLPPHKGHVLAELGGFRWRSRGFAPLLSFARGGLAEAWTGGAFPFNAAEMADFPLDYAAFAPFYGRIAGRIGVSGAEDDLARHVPVHEHLAPPLELDRLSRRLLERYAAVRERVRRRGVAFGRSRTAVLAADRGDRRRGTQHGRGRWGGPREAR
jgi:hypothetical protein